MMLKLLEKYAALALKSEQGNVSPPKPSFSIFISPGCFTLWELVRLVANYYTIRAYSILQVSIFRSGCTLTVLNNRVLLFYCSMVGLDALISKYRVFMLLTFYGWLLSRGLM